jgi:hypothetical protein
MLPSIYLTFPPITRLLNKWYFLFLFANAVANGLIFRVAAYGKCFFCLHCVCIDIKYSCCFCVFIEKRTWATLTEEKHLDSTGVFEY